MRLYDYLKLLEDGEELTVTDNNYDIETYFYSITDESDKDKWDLAVEELSKILTITKILQRTVVVNFSELIESHMDKIKAADLFQDVYCDTDSVMEMLDGIIAGNVSEEWFVRFVETLK